MHRLLILDGHNSHCTYQFIKFAAQHHIIIICLPSHTTHALQPCDVGVFGPLARAWKSQVTQASQENTPITKANLLLYYHKARTIALKSTTILSAFRKTGIYPFDRNTIPLSAFEPAKNTTTQAAQPLPAQLPSLLTPIPSPAVSAAAALTPNATPITSAAPSPSLDVDAPVNNNSANPAPVVDRGGDITAEPEPRQRYAIQVPPPLPHTASRRALREESMMLRDIIERVGVVLEQDYAQMKLMDLENERLRRKVFAKDQRKATRKKFATGQARHMTAPEMMEQLARQTWESAMGDLFKEASEKFKARRKAIDDFHKAIAAEKKEEERARKAADRQAKKLLTDAEKARVRAERVATRGRGRGRGRGHGRGRGRGGATGQTATIPHDPGSNDSEEQVLDTESTLTDEDDVPTAETMTIQSERRLPRACRARAPRFLPDDDDEEEIAPQVVRPRPKPRPILRRPVPAPEVSSAHDPGIQLAENDMAAAPQPGCSGEHAGGEIVLTASAEQAAALQAIPPQSKACSVPKKNSTSTRGTRLKSGGTGGGPPRSVLSREPSIGPTGSENVAESELPVRRSRRLAENGI